MRLYRTPYDMLDDEQKKRANCRSKTRIYQRRGKLPKGPLCSVPGCGRPAENHHRDYNDFRKVIRYCHWHHIEFHKTGVEPTHAVPVI
jgi:hypothetical protein